MSPQRPLPIPTDGLSQAAQRLVDHAVQATAGSPDEENLRHALEQALEQECHSLAIPWTSYQLNRSLRTAAGHRRFADAIHGALVIEYEPPGSFKGRGGAPLKHAQAQAEEYTRLVAVEEGRPQEEYVLVVWDGAHLAWGQRGTWQRLEPFSTSSARRLLYLLKEQGRPLVHPTVLRSLVGPDSPVGAYLIPRLFEALVAANHTSQTRQTKTTLLFTEWARLFGQVVGVETRRLQAFLARQSAAHQVQYADQIPAYLFALHTHIAIVAKLVAALALPNPAQDLTEAAVPLRQRLRALESGHLFADAGITNMLPGDFFSWYVDDAAWPQLRTPLTHLLDQLAGIDFDVTRKSPASTRDLFKGIYEVFVPRELRHALGEVYTPDWLAAHVLDQLGWQPANDLLDPTCGTGTFLLEAVKRRLCAEDLQEDNRAAQQLLKGLYGIDLNPLAVLAAKASLIVTLGPRLDPAHPITLPIFLADAINSATPTPEGVFAHTLPTEQGPQHFQVPIAVARSPQLHQLFDQLRVLIDADADEPRILQALTPTLAPLALTPAQHEGFQLTVRTLIHLHQQQWNGIWCPILADRLAAGAIPPVSHIAGNPPWVKWSHLPPAYAEFIRPLCAALNVFSQDTYVGGIESDISTVITFRVLRQWLAPAGRLGFLIPATVFSNESSQGFRRLEYDDGTPMAQILAVEDYQDLAPFKGVSNHPALLLLQQGQPTTYPVPYRKWSWKTAERPGSIPATAEAFRIAAQYQEQWAKPVPGTDAGPWLKGSHQQHALWETLFDAAAPSHYRARKGVSADLNGLYFVHVKAAGKEDYVWIQNNPDNGKNPQLPRLRKRIETVHLFPLIRGRGLTPFRAELDPEYHLLVPQRGMHGDPELPMTAPHTYQFLKEFEAFLRQRGSYRRYQQGQPCWSTWSTGPYTFSPYKVLWKEMSGKAFGAAYVGPTQDPLLGMRCVVPNNKLYFVPTDTLEQAQYLTGILNAPLLCTAIEAYAAQLSLGVSVIENLKIPTFDPTNPTHGRIAQLAGQLTQQGGNPRQEELEELDRLAYRIVC